MGFFGYFTLINRLLHPLHSNSFFFCWKLASASSDSCVFHPERAENGHKDQLDSKEISSL